MRPPPNDPRRRTWRRGSGRQASGRQGLGGAHSPVRGRPPTLTDRATCAFLLLEAIMAPGKAPSLHQRIYDAVRRIPRGRLATYGQIAREAGLPRQARLVGYALHAYSGPSPLPWHRVINAQGRISLRGPEGGGDLQRRLLAREGIRPGTNGRYDLLRYQWQPRAAWEGSDLPVSPPPLPHRTARRPQPPPRRARPKGAGRSPASPGRSRRSGC
jgi:methylated-DNA-protein-cysteine methyltransferase related protein